MFDEKRSKERMKANLQEITQDLEEDIDMLATEELMREIEELEEMMGVSS